MDGESTIENPSESTEALNWAKPDSTFDITKLTPHDCMTDIIQRGNYIHCNTGNHGMRIPHGQMLIKVGDKWDLIDQPLSDEKGEVIADNFTTVVN